MDIKSILYLKNCFVYTDDDKPEMTMPKQIDVKVTKPQNKNGHGRTRKCPIAGILVTIFGAFINTCQRRCILFRVSLPLLAFRSPLSKTSGAMFLLLYVFKKLYLQFQ